MECQYETKGHHFTEDDVREIKDLSRHATGQALTAIMRTAMLADNNKQQSIAISALCSAFLCGMENLRDNPEARKATDTMIGEILKALGYHAL
jgi:hypothetical protein